MRERISDLDKPIGKMKQINDFLPKPEELVIHEETVNFQ